MTRPEDDERRQDRPKRPGWLRRLLGSVRGDGNRQGPPGGPAIGGETEEDEENPDLDFRPGGWVGAVDPPRKR
jgi:hypothetical protein